MLKLTQMSSVMPDVFCAAGFATSRDGSRLYLMGALRSAVRGEPFQDVKRLHRGLRVRFVDDPSNGQPVAELADHPGLRGTSLGSNLLLEDPGRRSPSKATRLLPTLSSGDAGTLQPTGLGVFCDRRGHDVAGSSWIEYQGLSDPEYAIVSDADRPPPRARQ